MDGYEHVFLSSDLDVSSFNHTPAPFCERLFTDNICNIYDELLREPHDFILARHIESEVRPHSNVLQDRLDFQALVGWERQVLHIFSVDD